MFKSKFLRATAELALLTFLASLLALATADGFDVLSLAAWKTAVTASIAPVLAVFYAVVVRLRGDFNSPLATDTRAVPNHDRDLPHA